MARRPCVDARLPLLGEARGVYPAQQCRRRRTDRLDGSGRAGQALRPGRRALAARLRAGWPARLFGRLRRRGGFAPCNSRRAEARRRTSRAKRLQLPHTASLIGPPGRVPLTSLSRRQNNSGTGVTRRRYAKRMLTALRPQASGVRARYAASAFLALTAVLSPPPAPAQNSYGRFTGRVTDQQGAIIAGAKVKVTQSETNSNAETITNREGVYDLLNQLPGSYVLTVESDGFKKHARSGLVLRVGDIVELNVQLELGALSDSVSVTAEAPILETGTASLGQVVDNRMISEMPLSGRGVNYLMQLSPGAVSTNAPMHGWLPQARGSVSDVAVAGTRTRSSEFTLDGIPNMSGDGVIAFQPPPEMIQEFRVQTAAYDASLGRFAGASVNMVLKSGANVYHGTLWGSHLSRPLMTHPYFINSNLHNTATNRPGETFEAKRSRLWPASRTNRYRVQFGGPIRIPKLYDGRNRTFISYGNELMERNFNNQTNTTVPTEEQRRGDFSRLLALGASYQIFDPATVTAAAGGRFQRMPLPGNIVPASRISPIAQRLLPFYPLPNTPGTADFRNNFVTATPATIDYRSHMLRADQVINDRHRFYVSFSTMRTDGDQGRNLNNDANGSITVNRYNSLALDYVWTVSPSTVANLRYGVTRQANLGGPPTAGLDLTTLGLPASFANRLDRALTALPEID
ncbi:MAG: carboxypeptidase regulatory-like domain-containing protein, partial [Acidobacteria bacterium]|nr:carboxypeptidase regulatory-like domain-containing protein [Acidobacteriota bacterium]